MLSALPQRVGARHASPRSSSGSAALRLGLARVVPRPSLRTRSGPDAKTVDSPARGQPEDSPTSSTDLPSPTSSSDVLSSGIRKTRKRKAESTDAIATFLTRRFGIAGGLAWLGFLAVGSLGEQIKTRLEVASEESGVRDVEDAPEVVLPSGVSYRDLRIGGGQSPFRGALVVLEFTATADGQPFESTRARGRPIVLTYGSRPYSGGMCEGVEQVLATMRAGGRRTIVVPPALGFGERGATFSQGQVPPGATLKYDLELVRVSVPPS
ncbi:hypothetical protein HYH03_014297 [Edaphochlamys debaryana]|uniref:peptidylprolyl isomerase n=1 Tax=Edaphochlamys debaryana TaxID=47281 RepID=A0A835XNB8_9CHLO|nr:hypothetical protein HYH03_014297 [Edaphochlamys debaryana]|eukprot:KAG2487051.1 hypothetical protein HYH03_014297 [Edaphochlamys debaryana]